MNNLTQSQECRILDAIADCDRLIVKEQPRPVDTRPAYMQRALDHAITHRAKLVGMLAGTVAVPQVWIAE